MKRCLPVAKLVFFQVTEELRSSIRSNTEVIHGRRVSGNDPSCHASNKERPRLVPRPVSNSSHAHKHSANRLQPLNICSTKLDTNFSVQRGLWPNPLYHDIPSGQVASRHLESLSVVCRCAVQILSSKGANRSHKDEDVEPFDAILLPG